MKSRIRKIVGVALSVMMLLTMTVSVFAAGSKAVNSGSCSAKGIENFKAVASSEQPSAAEIASLVGSNYTFDHSYEITGNIVGDVEITFPLSGAVSSTKAAVLHKVDGTWIKESSSVGTGIVTASGIKSLSPFAVVVDKSTLKGTSNNGTSPKTGESSMVLGAGVLAIIAVVGIYGVNRKKTYNK